MHHSYLALSPQLLRNRRINFEKFPLDHLERRWRFEWLRKRRVGVGVGVRVRIRVRVRVRVRVRYTFGERGRGHPQQVGEG